MRKALKLEKIINIVKSNPGWVTLRPNGPKWEVYDFQNGKPLVSNISERLIWDLHHANELYFDGHSYWPYRE